MSNQTWTEERFARLRFLFWKHLDADQRLYVFKQRRVLPMDAESSGPQTFESELLKRVHDSGREELFWSEMTPFLPEGTEKP